jgi:1-deoxy-D-xylulose-5-phosphate synthase
MGVRMKCAITPAQVREQILSAVSANGGHLASSLGAVELAFALTEVFDPAVDRVVWDVGHQAYAWKILTGRAEKFHALRLHGGVAPFLSPSESDADAFISGHAGVAIAAAAGCT